MRAQGGGMIVNISSRVSKNYYPNISAYASTKYALNAISLTAREELKKDNIIVGVIYPGVTDTDFRKNAIVGGDPDFTARARDTGIPVGAPDQVAEKILEQIRSEEAEVSV